MTMPHASNKPPILQRLRAVLRRSGEVLVKEGPGPFISAIFRKVLIATGLRTWASFFPNYKPFRIPTRKFDHLDLALDPFGDPTGFDVICLPIIDWDYRFQRPQQLMRQFAKNGHRVFYGSISCNPNVGEPGSILNCMRIMGNRVWDFQFPSSVEHFDLYQEQISEAQVQHFLDCLEALKKQAGIVSAVLVVDFPNWAPLALKARERFGWPIIYDCMEDHGAFSVIPASLVEMNEASLAQNADLVLAVSEKIAERLSSSSDNVLVSPNATDFAHFRYPIVPIDPFSNFKRPVIGYFGVITEWFDLNLVLDAARLRPDWSFVLIGEIFNLDTDAAKALPNVLFMGEKPYNELPRFANAFDVAIIPHKRTRRTEWAGSVKLYEYMSTGRPVVATPLAWLRPLQELVPLADTPETFVSAIEQAMQKDSPDMQMKRLSYARHNSWESRASEIEARAEELFPKASIIILTHNQLDVTRMCLESIRQYTSYPNYELVLVDNASTDGTPEYLLAEQLKDSRIKVLLNASNLGFAAGNNQGIQASTGEYIILLNNDTIVTSRWLSRLIEHLSNLSIGAIGPVTNMSGNESRITVTYQSLDDIHPFARQYTQQHWGETFDIKVLTMFCIAMRREVVEQVGGLDERYGMGMFEDDDYALRLRQAGYTLVCANDVFIHHIGNVSFKQYGADLYQKLLEENCKKFEEKWGVVWEPHQARKTA